MPNAEKCRGKQLRRRLGVGISRHPLDKFPRVVYNIIKGENLPTKLKSIAKGI